MGIFSQSIALCLTIFLGLAACFPSSNHVVPRYFRHDPISPRELSVANIQNELGPQLSNGSTIFGPESPNFANATHRFSLLAPPEIQVVVIPMLESDVSKIVEYCAANSIEFLAYNRGHGSTASLGVFKGLEIDLQMLNVITIAADKESVLLQGGTYNDQVMRTLWAEGYVTMTGSTDCVGVLGPGLGGGHGRYEGLYGLISDSFIHLNAVLANGTAIGVNATSHPDLFWALQGAGHNFAVITSVRMKIHPREVDTWHYHSYYWTGDKLEEVFEAINEFHKSDNGTTPPLAGVNAGAVLMNANVSTTEASLYWSFTYAGSAEDAEKVFAPFAAIENVGEESGDVPYPDLSAAQKVDAAHGGCNSGVYATSSILMKEYNITAQRQAYDSFNEYANKYPELATVSRYYYEGYATKAVQEVNDASTAYPHRDEIHIVYFSTGVPDGSDLLDSAMEWAESTFDIWKAGEDPVQPKIYVNYAKGTSWETNEAIYGYETWRLDKLRRLKAQYDPDNRFSYYVPIIPPS
ncbi:hypothetical protein F5Y15DRAFT_208138 [Xylariaceae sp. FL0016]|nr:hypothetical protein F5Y15DRAFT_208138 [Xylariaceae sp. FL0016]